MDNGLNWTALRETVRGSGTADGKVIRQQHGIAVYAHVRVSVRGLNRGQGTVFSWTAGSNIPTRFAPAVLLGVQRALNSGVLAGCELMDVCATVENGSYHEEDSTADAFSEAAEIATIEAIRQAIPMVLEALSFVTIVVPLSDSETVKATVATRSWQVEQMEIEGSLQTFKGTVPAEDARDLMIELLRTTEGRATVSIASAGFRNRLEGPEDMEQLVRR